MSTIVCSPAASPVCFPYSSAQRSLHYVQKSPTGRVDLPAPSSHDTPSPRLASIEAASSLLPVQPSPDHSSSPQEQLSTSTRGSRSSIPGSESDVEGGTQRPMSQDPSVASSPATMNPSQEPVLMIDSQEAASSPQLEAPPPSKPNDSNPEAGEQSQVIPPGQSEKAMRGMPLRYEKCRVADLVVVISSMLEELCEANASISLNSNSLTRFHSRSPPGVSIKDYLGRLAKHACLIPPILLTMVFLIDRLCELYPSFQLNALTVHRYLIASATITCKGLSDAFLKNDVYAKVGGVQVRELAILELELLWRLNWRIVPRPDQLDTYYRSLVERCPGYLLDPEP